MVTWEPWGATVTMGSRNTNLHRPNIGVWRMLEHRGVVPWNSDERGNT